MELSSTFTFTFVIIILATSCATNDASNEGIYRYSTSYQDPYQLSIIPSNQTFLFDTNATFNCISTETHNAELSWRRDGQQIRSGQNGVEVWQDGGVSCLYLSHLKSSFVLECVLVYNQREIPHSIFSSVTILPAYSVPHGFPSITPLSFNMLSAYQGQPSNLSCQATGNTPLQYLWMKDHEYIDRNDSRIFVSLSGFLLISTTQKQDDGVFQCTVSNQLGMVFSEPSTLYVKERKAPPNVVINRYEAQVVPGEDFNFTCEAVGYPVPSLKWVKEDEQEVEGRLKQEGKKLHLLLTNVRNSATFKCVGDSELGSVEREVKVLVRTVPQPPSNLEVTDVTSSSASLTWTPSKSHDHGEHYRVQYRPLYDDKDHYDKVDKIRGNTLSISNLKSYTVYEFCVIAVNQVGAGECSKSTLTTTGELAPSTAPEDVHAKCIGPDRIAVDWKPPKFPNGKIEGYKISYTSQDSNHLPPHLWTVQRVNQVSMATINNLRENKWYMIGVAAYTRIGDGPMSKPVQALTTPGVLPTEGIFDTPELPKNFQGEASSPNSIQLKWDPPPNISGYDLFMIDSRERKHKVEKIDGNQRSYLVKNLTPNTTYNLRLVSYNRRKENASTPTIQVITLEFVPTEPRKLKLETLNSSSIQVHWKPPSNHNHGSITDYKVVRMELDHNDVSIKDPVFSLTNGTTHQTITGLKADTAYQVFVIPLTGVLEGRSTKTKKIRTRGAVPNAPKSIQVKLMEDQTALITWQPPRNTHIVVKGYKVGYSVVGDSKVEERRIEESDKLMFRTGTLQHGVEYEFRVFARNKVDYGEAAIDFLTTPDAKPLGSPLNLTAMSVNGNNVRLSWQPPHSSECNGRIVTYEVQYQKREAVDGVLFVNVTDSSILIENLEFYTDYQFQIRAYTSVGAGPWTIRMPFRTNGFVSLPPPQSVKLRRLSSSSVQLHWNPPPSHNNYYYDIAKYRVYYSMFAMADVQEWSKIETESTRVTIDNLDPLSIYAFRVASLTSDGQSSNLSEAIHTNINEQADFPDAVRDLRVRHQSSDSITLEWKPPRKPGVLKYFIEYEGRKSFKNQHGMEEGMLNRSEVVRVSKNDFSKHFNNLVPHTQYLFNVSAKFIDNRHGPILALRAETSSAAPPPFDPPRLLHILSNSVVMVRLFSASEKHGPITNYHVIVVTFHPDDLRMPEDYTSDELLRGARLKHHNHQHKQPTAWIAAIFDLNLPMEMTLGDGSKKVTINRPLSTNHAYRIFVRAFSDKNKCTSSPFSTPISTNHQLMMKIARSYHHPTHHQSNHPYTKQSFDLLYIVAPVCASVVFILLCILLSLFFRKRKMTSRKNLYSDVNKMLLSGNDNAIMMASSPSPGNNTHSNNDPVELRRTHFLTPALSSHPPIAISDFPSHLERLKANNNNLFSLEYESIDPAQQFTWEASSSEGNKHKNRYANVVAYDSTRVQLKSTDTIVSSDYINANYMDGYRRKNAYIATQGPSPETYDDFWRMVWEEGCECIVMITRLEERNRVKCNRYWPCRGTEVYNSLEVTLLDTNELTHYTIRTFAITKIDSSGEVKESNGTRREVKQFQFTSWPDHGIPLEFTSFSLFINRVKSHNNPTNPHNKSVFNRSNNLLNQPPPVVVHCSAGVGRTGVFIIIDSMLERIKHEATLDIYGHVTCLRAQRNYMVQTEDQYVFIHDLLLDYMRSGNTEVQARNLYAHIQHLSRPDPTHPGRSFMQSEFARLNDLKMENLKVVSAQLAWNKHKNKLSSILPYESSRVCLMPIRGVEGSDYINANFIDGYKQAKAYIATQGPMTDTIEDFWRMAWECNSTIIVVLCKPRELGKEMYQQYWPNNRSARYQYYVVDPMAEYNMPQYILREFKVTDARDGHSRTMRQFQFTDWPEEGVPVTGEGFIDFIGQVHKTKEQFGQEGPITVHCSSGAGRSGVFTALSHLLERMRSEGVIDLFTTAKLLRLQRPRMLQTEEQYAFCYRSSLEYLGSFDHYAD